MCVGMCLFGTISANPTLSYEFAGGMTALRVVKATRSLNDEPPSLCDIDATCTSEVLHGEAAFFLLEARRILNNPTRECCGIH